MDATPKPEADPTDPRVDLAVERTLYALERTQLAWIRTTLALLGSGLALDKGLEYFRSQRLAAGTAFFPEGHAIGIALSVGASLLMLVATVVCLWRLRQLRRHKGIAPILQQPVLWASFLVTLLGAVVAWLQMVG